MTAREENSSFILLLYLNNLSRPPSTQINVSLDPFSQVRDSTTI